MRPDKLTRVLIALGYLSVIAYGVRGLLIDDVERVLLASVMPFGSTVALTIIHALEVRNRR